MAELLPANTPTSLLFYLAVSGDWVSRQELAYLYRPDEPETVALSYLRLQLHRAQQYEWAAGLELEHNRVRWRAESDVAAARAAFAARDWPAVIANVNGLLLDGFSMRDKPTFDTWLDLEREGCQRWLRAALEAEAAAFEERGDFGPAAELRGRLAQMDSFDEDAFTSWLRSLALAGRREQALRAFEDFRTLLDDELGAEPADSTVELVEQIRGNSLGPPAPTKPQRERLPQPSTRFVGRRKELGELSDLLEQPECRLLTIVGLGGTGKTRLALELARQQGARFRDGAVFVPLFSAATLEQALLITAQAVGLQVDPKEGTEAQLLAHLAEMELLVVLDNFEHLPETAPFVAAVLEGAPSVVFLVTSRASTRLQGEWLYDLSGLEYADGESSEALDLFVRAARRVAPQTEFSPADLAHVARVCRRVEGMPLALELASAWVRAMPIARIADEIEQGFGLLASDLADLPERHRSIQAVLDRTWEDLTVQKADVLARLSVFEGGSSLDAAEAVSGGRLTIILSLMNQSLLHRDSSGRIGCHPLVAQYAARVLARDERAQAEALDAHAHYYAGVLARLNPEGRLEPGNALKELASDIANLEKAWRRLLEARDVERIRAAVDTLLAFYNVLGMYQRGSAVCAATLQGLGAPRDPVELRLHCDVHLAMSSMARESGHLQDGLEHAGAALRLAESADIAELVPKSRRYKGDVLQMMGDFAGAEEEYGHAYRRFEELGELLELANCLNSLASLEAVQEKYEPATERFTRCVELFEQLGDELARAIALNNLGYLADAQGHTEIASKRYEEGLAAFEQLGFNRGIAAVKNNLVVLYGELGRLDEAEAMGRESLELKTVMNDRLGIIISHKNLGDIKLMREQPGLALGYYSRAISLAVEIGAIPRLLQVLPGYARALADTQRQDEATAVLEALHRHPLAPPSARARALELAPGLDTDAPDDETLLERVIERLAAAMA